MFSGQAASSFGKGLMQGYAFADQAVGEKQDREIKQQQAKQQAEIRTEQIKKSKMYNDQMGEFNQLTGGDEYDPNAQVNALQSKVTSMEKQAKQQTQRVGGNAIKQGPINAWANTSTIKERDELLPSIKHTLKQYPEGTKALGIQNVDTLQVLRKNDPEARAWMADLIGQGGITMDVAFPEEDMPQELKQQQWESILDDIIEVYPAIKAEGKIVDMHSLSVATGSRGFMGPEAQKKADAQREEFQAIVDSIVPKDEDATDTAPREGGSRSWRNKNPGNMEYNDYTKSLGATGTDGRFAVFPTEEHGEKAMSTMLFTGKNYRDLTLGDAIKRYAPAYENNVSAYIKATGADPKQKMKDFSPEQQKALISNMKKHEGWKEGTVKAMDEEKADAVQEAVSTGKPIKSDRISALASMLGIKDPTANKDNSKIESFKFLRNNLKMSTEDAYAGSFGTKGTQRLSQDEKLMAIALNPNSDEKAVKWASGILDNKSNTMTKSDTAKMNAEATKLDPDATKEELAQAHAITDTGAMKTRKSEVKAGHYSEYDDNKEPTQQSISDRYTESLGAKSATKQLAEDSSQLEVLERGYKNLENLRKDVDSGKYKSGLGVSWYNKLVSKLPIDDINSMSIGDMTSYLEQETDLEGSVLDMMATTIKGAASDRDMESVRAMLGDINRNPDALVSIMNKALENNMDKAMPKFNMNYQEPYRRRLETLKQTKGDGDTNRKDSLTYDPKSKGDVSSWTPSDPAPSGYITHTTPDGQVLLVDPKTKKVVAK